MPEARNPRSPARAPLRPCMDSAAAADDRVGSSPGDVDADATAESNNFSHAACCCCCCCNNAMALNYTSCTSHGNLLHLFCVPPSVCALLPTLQTLSDRFRANFRFPKCALGFGNMRILGNLPRLDFKVL